MNYVELANVFVVYQANIHQTLVQYVCKIGTFNLLSLELVTQNQRNILLHVSV